MKNHLERKYGLFTAICMVVGIVIGSGVFFKAQTILQKTGGDMPLAILAWLIGGAIMLVCLLTFSFMGQKYERVNGLVDYAEATVGPRYGYFMGWFSATIYFPGMTSVLAWVSARYTLEFITAANPNFPMAIPAGQGGCLLGPECSRFCVGLGSSLPRMLPLFWCSPLSPNAPPHHTWLTPPSSGLSLNTPQSQRVAYFLHCA